VGQRVHIWSGDGDLVVDVRDRSPSVWWIDEKGVSEVRPGSPLFAKAAETSTFRMAWNLSWHPDEEILKGALDLLDRHQLARPHDLAAALLRARIELALEPGATPPNLPEHLATANPTDTASLCALADLCAVLARRHGDGGLAGLAMLWFDKALAKDPESVQALTSKGNLCLDIDAPAKGAELLEKAYALFPEDDDLARSLVIALRRAGREEDARALWKRLIDADPGHPDNQDLAEWFKTPLSPDGA
jgi:tetratricopeptide (TPR) repeat protein